LFAKRPSAAPGSEAHEATNLPRHRDAQFEHRAGAQPPRGQQRRELHPRRAVRRDPAL
jgi:hypothetical protein